MCVFTLLIKTGARHPAPWHQAKDFQGHQGWVWILIHILPA